MNETSILCGTDFSIHATRASEVAGGLAQRWQCPLRLVHVLRETTTDEMVPSVRQGWHEQLGLRLHDEAERLRQAGATVEEELASGQPYSRLVELSRRPGTRLIVVSSVGQGALSRWLIGSVAERVAETAPIPTLVLRSPEPFESWLRQNKPLKVLIGVDLADPSESPLAWVRELCQTGPCELVAGHVYWPPREHHRLGYDQTLPLGRDHAEVHSLLERELQARVQKDLSGTPVKCRVEHGFGRVDAHLLQMAHEEQADVIVLGTHQRHGLQRLWLGSVSRRILHEAAVNVMCVPNIPASDPAAGSIPEMKRVLVSTDLSPLGNRAIPHAYAAVAPGGTVCLMHAAQPFELAQSRHVHAPESLPNVRETHSKQRDRLSKQLQELIPSAAQARANTQIEIVENHPPAEAICQTAERFGADLICLASHGRTGLRKALLGSVAQTVLANTQRPVLVIRPPQEDMGLESF